MPDYDDALLNTDESYAGTDWDNLETGGMASEGKHLATIVKVKGELHNFKDYTGPQAALQLKIKDSLVADDIGRMVFDRINLPHHAEAQGNHNRRALIASRLGLIPHGTKDAHKINWKLLEGKDAVITVVHRKGEGKNAGKTYANIDFAGYEAAECWSTYKGGGVPGKPGVAGTATDQYSDI
jgi:hypothetical protein